MNIVEPYAKIKPRLFLLQDLSPAQLVIKQERSFELDDGIDLLQRIEEIGRVSHRSEDKQDLNSWKPFISAVVLQHGDWSITEHASVTVEALVDRGITHEWVRHRIGAYTQESTRFVNYTKGISLSFIKPPIDDVDGGDDWQEAMEHAEISYEVMMEKKSRPQIARSVLPNSLASKLIVTYNLRMWRHFFLMRTSRESHPQMRQVTIPLLEEFKSKIPLLYDDIVPESRQADNLCLPR